MINDAMARMLAARLADHYRGRKRFDHARLTRRAWDLLDTHAIARDVFDRPHSMVLGEHASNMDLPDLLDRLDKLAAITQPMAGQREHRGAA